MATRVHSSAVVDPSAVLGDDVEIGPFAIVGPHVVLGDGVKLWPHAVLDGHTRLGEGCEVYPGACVGLPPQDKKYAGEPTRLEIGPRTVIREHATLQPGTVTGIGETRVGADCLIMAYCHVAHDCVVGDGVIMANATQLAGHVTIEDFVILGGVTTVHQFVRVGTRAFTGAATRVAQDLPPFTTADGHPAGLVGLNTVGLQRAGFTAEAVRALKTAYKEVFVRGPFREGIERAEAELADAHPEVRRFVDFLRASERGVTRARKK